MGKSREYDIAFVGLGLGTHEFYYELEDKFFADFQDTEITNCSATLKVTLEKNTSFMMLKFEIDGSTGVPCDRCGNPLSLQLWDEFNLIIKLVENPDEMNDNEEDPDILYISRHESHIHLDKWLYEFVFLSIPNQRMCSEEEIGGPQCNKEVLAMLHEMKSRIENNNPLKQGLEKFKKNNH
ncbi:MAG: DUF177 domain-containing protein [Ginsengibacter sp.]